MAWIERGLDGPSEHSKVEKRLGYVLAASPRLLLVFTFLPYLSFSMDGSLRNSIAAMLEARQAYPALTRLEGVALLPCERGAGGRLEQVPGQGDDPRGGLRPRVDRGAGGLHAAAGPGGAQVRGPLSFHSLH